MKLQCYYDRNHCSFVIANLCVLNTLYQWQMYFIKNKKKIKVLKKICSIPLMTNEWNTRYGYIMIKSSHNDLNDNQILKEKQLS